MKCPNCGYKETRVIDSRLSGEGQSIRRRRECLKCEKRFTTYEYIEKVPVLIAKRDGRREPFDRNKILNGLIKACEKRPVPLSRLEEMADEIEREVQRFERKEVPSVTIGEMVMDRLAQIDEVAYVRFASVYRQFRDVNHFMNEIQKILEKEKTDPLPRLNKPRKRTRKGAEDETD